MMNGEVFISPESDRLAANPTSPQLPATLFNQVDVIKSSTASQTERRHQRCDQSAHQSAVGFAAWIQPIAITPTQERGRHLSQDWDRRGERVGGFFFFLVSYNGDGGMGALFGFSGDFSDTTRVRARRGAANAGGNSTEGPRPVRPLSSMARKRRKRGRLQRLPGGVERRADSFPDRCRIPTAGGRCERLTGKSNGVVSWAARNIGLLRQAPIQAQAPGRPMRSFPDGTLTTALKLTRRLLLRASRNSTNASVGVPIQFHQLARARPTCHCSRGTPASNRVESVQHAAARPVLGPARKSTPPKCTKKWPGRC